MIKSLKYFFLRKDNFCKNKLPIIERAIFIKIAIKKQKKNCQLQLFLILCAPIILLGYINNAFTKQEENKQKTRTKSCP